MAKGNEKMHQKVQKEKLGFQKFLKSQARKLEQKPLNLNNPQGCENFSHSGKLVDRGLTVLKILHYAGGGREELSALALKEGCTTF